MLETEQTARKYSVIVILISVDGMWHRFMPECYKLSPVRSHHEYLSVPTFHPGGSAESAVIELRKGQAPTPTERAEFSVRFRASYIDPAYRAEDQSIARLEEVAWAAYTEGRKAPFTQKAGSRLCRSGLRPVHRMDCHEGTHPGGATALG